MSQARNVAILVFNGIDSMDFCGPLEVLSIGGHLGKDLNVYTVGENDQSILTANNLSLNPTYHFDNCPKTDLLVVPGGIGSRTEMNNEVLVDWVRRTAAESELVLSVCTGALIAAKAGLLEGKKATTHHSAIELLKQICPANAIVQENVRYVDNEKIVMSAGITAGIDASLHVVSRLLGEERALETAGRMEYEWKR
ncbi:DJ-1/PfpI family protein [Paenibacillus sp. NEAU-GSW1]|uniref:DJ-1/PfpI family protein n=1 Tax=Paenibacillus sp. NEAU-GSW1 TaxID=2682486 RepID=UPI0012E0C82D|nr:DJ-1/PfpI family protein [Paenibacillus sp. NEAU-GSW1]MUT67032.1 DJ-1/PfpI family protein [Paenibacillus sp. NEAU-GSW1]